ncbi:hypothetical protein HNP46_000201 [Pseudomonas nitritireducens]|uniref:Uncharacterized protein n=1 Tax=Pseudomonas nitroreducens TaxID=46680 RepID=A0A7W7KF60_PSENT|nr:DUF308 domain-containing protein [Pseudomonas nitritireducens]MBB4861390.1 hypothetical protein [Pseudomonas nitritireducens]
MINRNWLVTVALSLSGFAGTALAADGSGVDVAANFSTLFDFSALVAAVIGVFLIGSGIYGFYTWAKGDGRDKSIGQLIFQLISGTLLISIGWAYGLLKGSFIGDNNNGVTIEGGQYNLALDQAAINAASQISGTGFGRFMPASTFKTILAFVFFFGFVALISGIFGLKEMGNAHNRSQHPLLSPIVKITGGVICMNITWFGCIVSSLIGVSMLCIE